MRAIELLTEYAKLTKRIHLLEIQIEAKRELAEALSGWPEGDRVQSSHEPDKIGRAVADLADKELELVDMKLEAIGRMNEIEEMLRELTNPDYALVLEYKYIRGMTWDQTADNMFCTPRWAMILRDRALRAMDERMNE